MWYKNPLSIVYNVSAKPRAGIVWQFPGPQGIYTRKDDADGHGGDRDLLVITNSHANWASEDINNRKQGGGTLNVEIEHDASTTTHSHQINVECQYSFSFNSNCFIYFKCILEQLLQKVIEIHDKTLHTLPFLLLNDSCCYVFVFIYFYSASTSYSCGRM